MLSREQLLLRIHKMGRTVGAHEDLVEVNANGGDSENLRRVEVRGDEYHYVLMDRDQEVERFVTRDEDELLYRVFKQITFSMGGAFELAHRRDGADPRRAIFQFQLECLGRLNERWQAARREEIEATLAETPYTDGL